MTAREGLLRTAATIGAAFVLYVGSYGPVRAHEAHRLMPPQKWFRDPTHGASISFNNTFYAPFKWLPGDSPIRDILNKYTYFSYKVMYGHPAETLFL